jgi:membrane-bound lytic murein transglycosylase A
MWQRDKLVGSNCRRSPGNTRGGGPCTKVAFGSITLRSLVVPIDRSAQFHSCVGVLAFSGLVMHFAKTPVRAVVASLVGAVLFSTDVVAAEPLKLAGSQLEPVKWTELAGWSKDDHLAAFAAYQASCRALRKGHTDNYRPIRSALLNVCRKAAGLLPQNSQAARAFFEENFQPVRMARLGESEGLLTGYFEPIVQGSRFPNPEFHVPVYRRPHDLVVAGQKPGSNASPNKGARIGRLNEKGQVVPYYDRGAIEAGALDGQKLELCWLKDPSDLLAMQIEGSGRVILEDGTPLRISYDSHNGYSFSSTSRALSEPTAHPDEVAKARASNRSYVFFRITGLSNDGEPVGAQGVPLTPGRSIAVDRLHDYGTPFFIQANLPIESAQPVSSFGRLMIAQDTGSAIVGPARADLYWGAGEDAGRIANRIRNAGRFVMLLPRELDIVAAGKQMALPPPKPKVAQVEVRKPNSKGKAALAKSELDARVASAYARGATSTRINGKRPVSHSAPPPVPVSKRVKKAGYKSSAPRAAAAYARSAESTRVDGKPSASHSAPPSALASKHVKKADYESSAPRAASAYARGVTSTRIDGKPSVLHSAPPFVPVSKRPKKANYESSAPRAAVAAQKPRR